MPDTKLAVVALLKHTTLLWDSVEQYQENVL